MLKKVLKRSICVLLALVLCLGVAGCKKSADDEQKVVSNLGDSYPLDTDATITYWMQLNSNVLATEASMTNLPFAEQLQKETGVKIEYIHPSAGQIGEQFNIMLASGSLPDIIEYDWYNFPGGPQKAIDDEYIIPLNDIIDKYCPNLKSYLEEHPDVDKLVKTDSGVYYVFPMIKDDDLLLNYMGPTVRKDWLDKLNLDIPETMEDWENMLRLFKEKKGADAPLSYLGYNQANTGAFSGAYGVKKGFYVDGGKVKYGPAEDGYKEFLETFARWYKEGLLDPNISAVDNKILEANMLNGKTGATLATAGGNIGKWLPIMAERDPEYALAAAPYPVLNKGERPKFGQLDWYYITAGCAAITTSCKNVELAARLLDYGYSEAGRKLYNYGIEGTSYNMVDGYPTYTDEIIKNPQGLSISNAIARYARGCYTGPFIQEKPYIEQYYTTDVQKNAIDIWKETDNAKYSMPLITCLPEESSEMANIMNEVNTYVDEMQIRFITGLEPIENFDKYVSRIKSMGIDDALKIQQAAYDRFGSRK